MLRIDTNASRYAGQPVVRRGRALACAVGVYSSECTDFAKRSSSVRRRRVIPLPSRQREMIRTMPFAAKCTSQLPACKPNRPVSRLTWDFTEVPKGLRNDVYCSEGGSDAIRSLPGAGQGLGRRSRARPRCEDRSARPAADADVVPVSRCRAQGEACAGRGGRCGRYRAQAAGRAIPEQPAQDLRQARRRNDRADAQLHVGRQRGRRRDLR